MNTDFNFMKKIWYKAVPLDIFISSIAIIIGDIFILSPLLNDSMIRTLMGMPITLFIPGYLLLSVLFPKKNDLENIERIILSLGLSIAIIPLIGLFLNFTYGINLKSIVESLTLYSLILAIVATYRKR